MTAAETAAPSEGLDEGVLDPSALLAGLRAEVQKVIVGQEEVIDLLLLSLLARGHAIFEGVPGLAKTLLVSTLARASACSFQRIQFTPDLMPSDITGGEILEEDRTTGAREFRFVPGPIFSNLVLADEVNRTPPRTQAALLQAMQERQVSAGGRTHPLPAPFLVFATQNPLEQEGTYPLPEAQLDRFMFHIDVGYPSAEEELLIVERTTGVGLPEPEPVITPAQLLALQRAVREVPISRPAMELAIKLARSSRPGTPEAPDWLTEMVSFGAGPRASQYLVLGARARALLRGRQAADNSDILALAEPVLSHRLGLTFRAEARGLTRPAVVRRLVEAIGSGPDALS